MILAVRDSTKCVNYRNNLGSNTGQDIAKLLYYRIQTASRDLITNLLAIDRNSLNSENFSPREIYRKIDILFDFFAVNASILTCTVRYCDTKEW